MSFPPYAGQQWECDSSLLEQSWAPWPSHYALSSASLWKTFLLQYRTTFLPAGHLERRLGGRSTLSPRMVTCFSYEREPQARDRQATGLRLTGPLNGTSRNIRFCAGNGGNAHSREERTSIPARMIARLECTLAFALP